MSYRGHIKDGAVVLDPPAQLPEGSEVRIEILPDKMSRPDTRGNPGPYLLSKWRGRGHIPGNLSVDNYLKQVRDDHGG
jgi:hypothetical protein